VRKINRLCSNPALRQGSTALVYGIDLVLYSYSQWLSGRHVSPLKYGALRARKEQSELR
jgi:hypothetical protein